MGLYEQSLLIKRAVGDWSGEADTLNNIAGVYAETGRSNEALGLLEQSLFIKRAVGNWSGEADTLNNMATVYSATGRKSEALTLYERALLILRAVGNRWVEAATLSNMATVYSATERMDEALTSYEHALLILRDIQSGYYAQGLTKFEIFFRKVSENVSETHNYENTFILLERGQTLLASLGNPLMVEMDGAQVSLAEKLLGDVRKMKEDKTEE